MQFVWFLGSYAVGKATTIKKCLDDPAWAAETFDIDVSNGLQQLKSGELPPVGFRGTALIKWQFDHDSDIELLQAKFPDAEHIAILLRPEPEEHLKGWREKYLDEFQDRPDWVAVLKDERESRQRLTDYRATDEAKARTHRGKTNRFSEYEVKQGDYLLIPEYS